MKINLTVIILVLSASCQFLSAEPAKQAAPLVEQFLIKGQLAEGEKALNEAIKKSPQDDDLQFQLGTVQFLRGVERLVQSLHAYGLTEKLRMIPLLDLPLPPNLAPRTITYEGCRKMMEDWLADLQRVEATLAKVKREDVKMSLHFALIRLDLNGDRKAEDDETLWKIYARLNRGGGDVGEAASFVITFDRADALWLRGYCHLLMAIDEFFLAYDFRELFERAGHVLFPKVDSPYPYLQTGPRVFEYSQVDLTDVIAFIHLLNFPVKDPERTKKALTHLESMTRLSREMWKLVLAETDDDREWIPSPKQHGVIPNVRVTDDMVKNWSIFLDELDAILAGKKLIPFWRSADGRGVNIHKILTEPRPFDLVLWVQGSAAAPYLEKGPVTTPEVWRRLQDTFEGNFIGFAIWFN